MIEIFRTNITEQSKASLIIAELKLLFNNACISFDLEDIDRVLRIQHPELVPQKVIDHICNKGFFCEVLDA